MVTEHVSKPGPAIVLHKVIVDRAIRTKGNSPTSYIVENHIAWQ